MAKTRKAKVETLTRRDLAAVFGVHMQTVTKWEQDGMPVAARGRKGVASGYREAEVRAWLKAREDIAKRDGTVDVAKERARKERAQAIESEQRVAIKAGQFLPVEEVEKAWGFERDAIRAAILNTYTQADRVHRAGTLEGVAGIEATLRDMAHELLRELSDEDRALPPSSAA